MRRTSSATSRGELPETSSSYDALTRWPLLPTYSMLIHLSSSLRSLMRRSLAMRVI